MTSTLTKVSLKMEYEDFRRWFLDNFSIKQLNGAKLWELLIHSLEMRYEPIQLAKIETYAETGFWGTPILIGWKTFETDSQLMEFVLTWGEELIIERVEGDE